MTVTSHGSLAVEETGGSGIPVLLIHGSSSCRGVFRNQTQGWIAKKLRLLAFDVPGHGQSGDAPDADAAVELLDKLGVAEAIVLGWSLGARCVRFPETGQAPLPRYLSQRRDDSPLAVAKWRLILEQRCICRIDRPGASRG